MEYLLTLKWWAKSFAGESEKECPVPASEFGKTSQKDVCPRQSRNQPQSDLEKWSICHPQNVGFIPCEDVQMYTTICKSSFPSALNYRAADDEPICLGPSTHNHSPPKAYHTAIEAHRHHLVPCFIALAFPREPHPSHPASFHKLMKDHELASRPGPTPSRKSKAQLRWERLENAFRPLKR